MFVSINWLRVFIGRLVGGATCLLVDKTGRY